MPCGRLRGVDLENGYYEASSETGVVARDLKKADVSAYRFDIRSFCLLMQNALGWLSSPMEIPGLSNAYQLGHLPIEYGGHPIYFGAALDSQILCEIIDTLSARIHQRSFLLMVPTRSNINGRVNTVLDRANGQLVSCDEIFNLTDDKNLYVSPTAKSAIGEMFGVKPSGNIFKRNGQGDWTVAFDGDSIPVKHVTGLSYIAILLGSPGIEFRVQDLVERVTGINSAHTKGISDPLATPEAIRKINDRLEDAFDELQTAQRNNDLGTIESRQHEIETLEQEKRRCIGLSGKIRSNSELRKMTKRVTRNIETAIKSISKQNKQLGNHLDRFIDRGLVLKYQPNE